ncbi:protein ECT2 isoform X2 [Ciona intestinalis]
MEVSSASSNHSIKLSSSNASNTESVVNVDHSERHPSIETRVCVVGSAVNNGKLLEQLKKLDIPYLTSVDGMEYAEEEDPYYETVFIMDEFNGETFNNLKNSDCRILGAPVINTIMATNEPLPYTSRPLYCTLMQSLNLCFTNFKTKEHLAHLVTLCHYMGACIRKDMSSKIDFLVTNTLHGPKYRTAVSLGTPVMKEEWIHRCWAARNRDQPCKATDDEFLVPCKSKPFEGCTLSFLGFSECEKNHMQEQAREQGGLVAEVGDPICSHLVVDESSVVSLPFQPQGKLYMVVQEWFWGSIQIEAKAAESMYVFQLVECPARMTRSSTTSSLLGTPKWKGSTRGLSMRQTGSSGKPSFSRKRSRIREETLAKLAQETDVNTSHSLPPRKRQSTDTSACISESMLDISSSTNTGVLLPRSKEDVLRDESQYASITITTESRKFRKRKSEDMLQDTADLNISECSTLYNVKQRKMLHPRKQLPVSTLMINSPAVFKSFSPLSTDKKIFKENENVVHSSMADISRIKEKSLLEQSEKIAGPVPVVTARYQVVMELLQTEKNYVGILQTILNLFKKPLDDPHQAGGPILASEDVKVIFSSLPDIEVVHRNMSDDLQLAIDQWNDSSCIGQLILKYADEFGRCYPPFVNFFEASVETLSSCETRSPRFHAFLKINQAKRECGRQTLAELLINPVQRLPRIILLLQDIKKHTEKENLNHQDVQNIQSSIDALKEVMTHINEDKRKTESQRQIFDIVYEVEGCPPTIVSSHRQFVARAEVIAVDDNLCNKGDHITFFIFSDCMEIAKRRRGIKSQSFKSPNVHGRPASVKCLKHTKLLSLSHIKKVVSITDSEDCQNAVSLFCRTPTDTQDWLYTFKVMTCTEDSISNSKDEVVTSGKENVANCSKSRLLQILSKHRANTVCKASDENFICCVNSQDLEVCTADLGSTLGRAVRAAKKSSRKLTRAFSFSRTPRRVMQRAVTNMLSPSQQRPPTGLNQDDSPNCNGLSDVDSDAKESTRSLRVESLCTPQRNRRGNRLGSTTSLQHDESQEFTTYTMKPSVSTMTLAHPPSAADLIEFPAIPTPPTRRRRQKIVKAATVAFGRTGSFRKRVKAETAV